MSKSKSSAIIASAIAGLSGAAAPAVAAPAKSAKASKPVKAEVSEQIAVKVSAAPKPAGQGLTFGQYFKLAQNTAAGAGKTLDEDQAMLGYEAGFKVREMIAAL